jgi:hypothetical protein
MCGGGGGQLVGAGARGVELAEQGQGLAAEGLFDEGRLVELLGAQDPLDAFGFGCKVTLAAGAFEQCA